MADSGAEECSPPPSPPGCIFSKRGWERGNRPLRFPRPYQSLLKFLSVIHVVHLIRRRLVEVVVVIRAGDPQILPLLRAGSLQQLRPHNGGPRRQVQNAARKDKTFALLVCSRTDSRGQGWGRWGWESVPSRGSQSGPVGRRDLPRPLTHLVIDVEAPLSGILADHPGFLQQEVVDFAAVWLSTAAELDLKVFTLGEKQGGS